MKNNSLMQEIQEVSFALVDLNLFLDSHPDCKIALEYFKDMQIKYAELTAEYEMKYGPLTAFDTNTEQGWAWIKSPWPWELEV